MAEAIKKRDDQQEPFQAILSRVGQGSSTREPIAPSSVLAQERIFISPLARRIAEQEGIDPTKIVGTGPNGRVVLADVESYLAIRKTNKPRKMDEIATALATMAGDKEETVIADPTEEKKEEAVVAVPEETAEEDIFDLEIFLQIDDAPSNEGKEPKPEAKIDACTTLVTTTASSTELESYQTMGLNTAPYFYLTMDIEVEELLKLREAMTVAHGKAVSIRDFAVRATAVALKKLPALNALWIAGRIVKQEAINVSIASGNESDYLIERADEKSIKDIVAANFSSDETSTTMPSVAIVADFGRYGIKECRGMTFGNHTLVLSLGVHEQRVVVKNGQMAVAHIMTCTLSADQRIVDGLLGAAFLATIKDAFEHPYSLVV